MADIFAASSDEEGQPGGGRLRRTRPHGAEEAQRRELHDAGYRDGAGGPEGHALGLQEGFDEAFARGLANGRALGRVLGALSGVQALEERVPRGLPGPPLVEGDKGRLEASLGRLTAVAPTMPAAADPVVVNERAEAAWLLEGAGVCGGGDDEPGGVVVERVLGP